MRVPVRQAPSSADVRKVAQQQDQASVVQEHSEHVLPLADQPLAAPQPEDHPAAVVLPQADLSHPAHRVEDPHLPADHFRRAPRLAGPLPPDVHRPVSLSRPVLPAADLHPVDPLLLQDPSRRARPQDAHLLVVPPAEGPRSEASRDSSPAPEANRHAVASPGASARSAIPGTILRERSGLNEPASVHRGN